MTTYKKTADLILGRGSDYLPDDDYAYILGDMSHGRGIIRWRTKPFDLLAQGVLKLQADQTGLDEMIALDGSDPMNNWHLLWNGTELQVSPMLMDGEGITQLSNWNTEPASLSSLTYSLESFQEDGTSPSVYAVRISTNAYAKLRIFKDATDGNQLKAEWFTYQFEEEVQHVGFGYSDPRDIVLERQNGQLVAYVSDKRFPTSNSEARVYRVAWDEEQKAFQTVSWTSTQNAMFRSNSFNDPQQLALCRGSLYMVNKTALLKVGTQQPVYNGLVNAMGLLMSEDGSTAFVTDRGGVNGVGRLLRLQLSSSGVTATVLNNNLGNISLNGYLEWADETRSAFYVPVPAQNKVLLVSSLQDSAPTISGHQPEFSKKLLNDESTPLAVSSIIMLSQRIRLLVGPAEAGRLEVDLDLIPGEVVLGIGFVPFQFIKQPTNPAAPDLTEPGLGKADTSSTGYFFQVNKVPFGGNLHLMLYHKGAHQVGARYYSVRAYNAGEAAPVSGIAQNFRDLRWDVPMYGKPGWVEDGPTLIKHNGDDLFNVRHPDDLWYNPYLGTILHSPGLKNGVARLEIRFYDENKVVMSNLTVRKWVLIDNNNASVSLSLPRLNGLVKTLHCGCMAYGPNKDAAKLQFDYAVHHPTDNAYFSLSFYGAGEWRGGLTVSGKPSQTDSPKEVTVRQLIGNCNVANLYVVLSASVRITNGYHWIGGDSTALSFTLVPEGTPLDE
jgi:hypothetical protein